METTSSEKFLTVVGSGVSGFDDGTRTGASFTFYQTLGNIAVDKNGTVYVGDMVGATGYIRKISSTGEVSNFCSNGSITEIDQTNPCSSTGVWVNAGLAVAPDSSIYYANVGGLYRISNHVH